MTQIGVTFDKLTRLTERSILLSLAEFAASNPTETLAAYAICTDDDLSTLFWVATTHEYVLGVADIALRYSAVEWPYGYGSSAFDAARAELHLLYDVARARESFQGHVAAAFQALVDALRSVRNSGGFEADTLLYVASTDPSEHLDALERRGVEYLNTEVGIDRWRTTLLQT